jgi:glycosyltransferase involved in cell wall biosynthesis
VRVLFATPAFWPAVAFGGPIREATELTGGLRARGQDVHVVTTSLRAVAEPPASRLRSCTKEVDGVPVTYLATPLRYRWMGATPSLPYVLGHMPRPDVVHVFGFRDVVTTTAAVWARLHGIPYVFQPLGMFEPRLRKIRLKRALDRTLYRSVWAGASVVVATSGRERTQIAAAGVTLDRIAIRGNGFPAPTTDAHRGTLRERVGIGGAPLALYVGRLAKGKGIEFLLAAAQALPSLHVVLVGPDDGHGILESVRAAEHATGGRIHALGEVDDPTPLYHDADIFVLPSSGESFGMAAAEAAAAGTAVVVSDRCGVAELLGEAALVVPYEASAVQEAVARLLDDADLRTRLASAGVDVARGNPWATIVERQEDLYRLAIERHG